jgi:hypothetical protein
VDTTFLPTQTFTDFSSTQKPRIDKLYEDIERLSKENIASDVEIGSIWSNIRT